MKDPTLSELDRGKSPPPSDAPLARWYTQVSTVPLSRLPIADLIRALRQSIHLEHTATEALARLEKGPQAGEAYPNELVLTISAIGEDFWRAHRALATSAANAVAKLDVSELEEDERDAFIAWRRAVSAASRGQAVLHSPNNTESLPLSLIEETTVGSGRGETVSLPGLGKRHFVIRLEDQGFFLYAQGDRLLVNGKDVADRHPLRSEDEIQAGSLRFRFEETR